MVGAEAAGPGAEVAVEAATRKLPSSTAALELLLGREPQVSVLPLELASSKTRFCMQPCTRKGLKDPMFSVLAVNV